MTDEQAHPGYRRVAVTGGEDAKEVLQVEMPPPSGERVLAASWTGADGEECAVRFEHDEAGMPVMAWHYGPTADDPDPGRMWHYGCGGEVLFIDDGRICVRCDQQEEVPS